MAHYELVISLEETHQVLTRAMAQLNEERLSYGFSDSFAFIQRDDLEREIVIALNECFPGSSN
jgi:hypothetical protein